MDSAAQHTKTQWKGRPPPSRRSQPKQGGSGCAAQNDHQIQMRTQNGKWFYRLQIHDCAPLHQIRTKSPYAGFSTTSSDSSVTFGTYESIVARRIFPARQTGVCPIYDPAQEPCPKLLIGRILSSCQMMLCGSNSPKSPSMYPASVDLDARLTDDGPPAGIFLPSEPISGGRIHPDRLTAQRS